MFDPTKVNEHHVDLFYHGKPDEDGNPVGLTDEQWDAQRDSMIAEGTYPLPVVGKS